MTMKRIRLELAPDREFPEGSRERGYEFAAPLDAEGHLCADQWRTMRERCRVKRFWAGQKDEMGHLVHRPGGRWVFEYHAKRADVMTSGGRLRDHSHPIPHQGL
jgi:hypothetical protein